MKVRILPYLIFSFCLIVVLSSTSCKKDEVEQISTPPTIVNPVDTTATIDTSTTTVTSFKDNTMRQVTGIAKDFEISHMYAQRWENVYNDSGNQEGVLRFDIRGPYNQKRIRLFFSGISNSTKTYDSSKGSSSGIVELKSGEFVVEKISVSSSNQNYWWKPNDPHHTVLKISGDDVIVEIKDFELGGGVGSIGKETFNIKFEFNLSDYNALSDNKLRLIKFK